MLIISRDPETGNEENAHLPHLIHLCCGSFGSVDMMIKPAIGGRVENIMNHMRRFFHRLVTSPIRTKYRTVVTLLEIPKRRTCRLPAGDRQRPLLLADMSALLNLTFVLMIEENVVRPPLGTEIKKELVKKNQN